MNQKKTIVILAPIHLYSDVRIFQKEAKTLQQNGYRVFLLARHTKNEYVDGIEIKAVPEIKIKLFRFVLQPLFLWRTLKCNPQIIHLHNPDTLPIGFILKLLGKIVIYDVHEDFTKKILVKEWIPSIFRKSLVKIVAFGEKLAGQFFDKIIVTQLDVKERIGNNCIIVENPPISRGEIVQKTYLLANNIVKEKCFRAIYVGSIGKIRGLFEMIKAMEYLNESYKIKSKLWLIGSIQKKVLQHAQKEFGWQYVDYLGFLPQKKTFAYIIKSDVGLIVIKNEGGYEYTNPNKLFEYQLFGIPFIASDFPYWRKLVNTSNPSGIFVDPIDVQEIAIAMYELATDKEKAKKFGENGKEFIMNNYNWEMESKKLLDLYNNL